MITREELEKKLSVLIREAIVWKWAGNLAMMREEIISAIPTSDHVQGTRPTKAGWFEFWNAGRWNAVETWTKKPEGFLMWSGGGDLGAVTPTNHAHWGNEIPMPTERPEE